MQNFLQDVRYGLRMLRAKPGFTAVAVIALALGIGANTAIFSVVDAILFRPLSYNEPDRVVALWEHDLKRGIDRDSVMAANYLDWKSRNQVFEDLAAHAGGPANLSGLPEPERLRGARVTANTFNVLGVPAEVGRVFLPDEDQPDRERVVVISYGLWKRRFAGDPALIGQQITLNNESYTVVGVMPAGFELPLNEISEVWVPMTFTEQEISLRTTHYLKVLGRLRPGVTIDQAKADMTSIANQLAAEYPKSNETTGAAVFPLHGEVVGGFKTPLLIFFGAVSFVLLIACANVANLMLARAASRSKEIAVRAALGASRWRLARQMLTESLVLSLFGGAAGLLLALWGIELLAAASLETSVPRANAIKLDARVLLFTLGVSLLTGLAFGSVPAFRGSRLDLNEALKDSDRGTGESKSRVRDVLVACEVGLAIVLLTGAGLLINSFIRLRAVDPGLKAEKVLTMNISLPKPKYASPEQVISFHRQLLDQVEAVPGVQASGTITFLPYGGSTGGFGYAVDSPLAGDKATSILSQLASPGFFDAIGIPLLKGRTFDQRDVDGAEPVIIVSDSLVKRYWPDAEPLGQRIKWGSRDFGSPWMTVVGVVGDVRLQGLDTERKPTVYVPHLQLGAPIMTRAGVTLRELIANDARSVNLVVRTVSDPVRLAGEIRNAVWRVDPDQPVTKVRTMDKVLADTMIVTRFSTWLLAVFAVVALVLAAAGIYGVISYSVTRRTREIGVRMALGAQARDVLRLMVGQGMKPALIGLLIGLASAYGLTSFMRALLFTVTPTDPMTFAAVATLLMVVALVACYVPARRAAKVDPMVALRHE